MTTEDLPAHLRPNTPDELIQVPVSMVPLREMSLENLRRLQSRLGMAMINPDQIAALSDLGIQAKDLGILNTIRGSTMVAQQSLVGAMGKLNETMGEQVDTADKLKVAKALGYLTGQLARVNTSSAKVEAGEIQATQQREGKKKMSFGIGMKVIPPTIDVEARTSGPGS